jgi:uncharacterized protein (TIGR03437 family)
MGGADQCVRSEVNVASQSGNVLSISLVSEPVTRVFGIINAAGGILQSSVAPGELVSLFGTQLGPAPGVASKADSSGKIPTILAGTQVWFDGIPAPLLYVSPSQINVVAPFGLTIGRNIGIHVVTAAQTDQGFPVSVVAAQPGIFGVQSAAAVNQDGAINSESNPAKPGSVVSIWVTGMGVVYPLPLDGQIADSAQAFSCCSVAVGTKSNEVLYAGAAPGMVAGVVQINFRLPASIDLIHVGEIPVTVTAYNGGGTATATSSIFVGP